MNTTISPWKKMQTLVRRELWEYRAAFLLVPLGIFILLLFSYLAVTIRGLFNDQVPIVSMVAGSRIQRESETAADALSRFAEAPFEVKERFWDVFYMESVPLLMGTFWLIAIYYFLMTLYQQRKDRSILIWNSLPVSSRETVISKLLACLIVTQGLFLLSMIAIQVSMLVIMLAHGLFFDVSLWDTYIAPSFFLGRIFFLVLGSFISAFWCWPFYAWLLFNSAWVKSAPLAWAGAPLLILIVPEIFLSGKSVILEVVARHAFPTWLDGTNGIPSVLGFAGSMLTWELLVSVLAGAGLTFAAIRINRSEDL